MATGLRPNLSFCRVGNEFVFLDIEKDRYFRLAGAAAADLARFITVQEPQACDFPALIKADILTAAERPTWADWQHLPIATQASSALRRGPTAIGEIAIALMSEARVRRALQRGKLQAIISRLNEKQDRARPLVEANDEKAHRIVRAFELAKFLRSPANLCLSRSIALTQRLRLRTY